MRKIKRALISLSNKDNLKKLISVLSKYKIELISSGGTFNKIKKLKFKCTEVSKYTESPEILGGRVKTLHPKIHGGILSKRKNKSHKKDLLKNIWGFNSKVKTRTLETHIYRLRKKITKNFGIKKFISVKDNSYKLV